MPGLNHHVWWDFIYFWRINLSFLVRKSKVRFEGTLGVSREFKINILCENTIILIFIIISDINYHQFRAEFLEIVAL